MPAKKAPAASNSPNPVKAEAADTKKDVKPAAPQQKAQAPAQTTSSPKPAQANAPGNAPAKTQGKGQQQQQQQQQQSALQPREPYSEDPTERAIQVRVFEFEKKIAALNSELEKIRSALDAEDKVKEQHRAEQSPLIAQVKGTKETRDSLRSEGDAFLEKMNEARRLRGLKFDKRNAIQTKLPRFNPPPAKGGEKSAAPKLESPQGQEAFTKFLDDQIRTLERELASSAVPLAIEKKKLEEISNIQKSKKLFKEYVALVAEIDADTQLIESINVEFQKAKTSQKEFNESRGAVSGQLDKIKENIEASETRRLALKERLVKTKEDVVKQKNERKLEEDKLYALRRQRRDAREEARKAEREREQERRKEQAERRKEREAKREEMQELEVPYGEEIEYCERLEQYLQRLLPKQKDETATSDAKVTDSEEYTILKQEDNTGASLKKGKKQKSAKITQGLKHDVTIYQFYEKLSLVPPTKLADVEASVAELKDKRKHFSKLSEDKLAAKAAGKAAKEAAANEAATKEATDKEAGKDETEVAPEAPKDEGVNAVAAAATPVETETKA